MSKKKSITAAMLVGGWNKSSVTEVITSGIRVGGESRQNRAMQIASKRKFRNYRKDRIIDTRQLGLALKKLHSWSKEGSSEELDIEASIEATGKNAGEIELVFHKARKNNIKLLLLLDAGGSMDVYAELCESLFSAAHSAAHLKSVEFLLSQLSLRIHV